MENFSRTILHSDMNCYYASVEMMQTPSLRGKPVAVCGTIEDRHGIVLAKSYEAKRLGVKTGMPSWEARALCPQLQIVRPHYDLYFKYSRYARRIYQQYSDEVEPFGLDECWIDVTHSRICGDGSSIAERIRKEVREKLGLTVSVGVSWNKIFAKLGSDLKKPDAVTVITPQNFREKVWPLPVSDLLYVGPATTRKLRGYGIHTIGDLAVRPDIFMRRILGKNGVMIRHFAAGRDCAPVRPANARVPVYSVGKGITCTADLHGREEVSRVIIALAQDVGMRLRKLHAFASGIQLQLRTSSLSFWQCQCRLETPVYSSPFIADAIIRQLLSRYDWQLPVRAVSIRADNLLPDYVPRPINLFRPEEAAKGDKIEKLDHAVDEIRRRFGKDAIKPACLLNDLKMPDDGRDEIRLPGLMYR